MLTSAEIYLWGTRIGILHLPEGRPYASFEYDRDFLRSGVELSPIQMRLRPGVYEFPDLAGGAFHGVPGLIADSLPDRFGNAVISQWLASQGRTDAEFNVIDRLCYTGTRGMGALEYQPVTGPAATIDERIDVAEMVRFASQILRQRQSVDVTLAQESAYSQLLQLGTSAGGARAKAIIAWNEATGEVRSGQLDMGPGYSYWLIKFDGVSGNGDHGLEDQSQYTRIEYAYYLMAQRAGIRMNECRLYEENGRQHFMTRRFDRVHGGKLHMQTLGAIAHIDYNVPGLCSYEQAAQYMRQMSLPAEDIEQFYRRMVFSVMAVNQDDHVKNTSFLMDRRGAWSLSPAYDITYARDPANRWLSAHQMSIHGKTTGITINDMLQCGSVMDISVPHMRRILEEVTAAIRDWRTYAENAGVREQTAQEIAEQLYQ